MPQIFHHSTNALAKLTIYGAVFILVAALWVTAQLNRSSWNTGQWVERQQPVQFSHKHHVGDDGLDCRYCHTSVEVAASAGLPPTSTCMNCHKQIWADSPYLEPVRASFRTGKPLIWSRVHRLPDYVHFKHDIHVAKGVGCSTCHGAVDRMNLMYQASPLTMSWCLNCHRNPEKYIRPREEVFNMSYVPKNQSVLGPELVKRYHVRSKTHCSACHY
jgi:hypothetical protein